MPEVATPNQAEREFETGSDEFFKGQSEAQSGLLFLNHKRVFDELLQESLETTRQQRTLFNKMVLDAQTLGNQIMQNAIAVAQKVSEQSAETANLAGKQAVRHADIAIDRQWNVDEQGYTAEEILGNQTFKEGIRAIVVAAVTEALNSRKV
jgi:hypothetical protein